MKTALALLFVLCAFTSTQCSVPLNWSSCLDDSPWHIDSVSIDADPTPGYKSTVTICGHNYQKTIIPIKNQHLTSRSGLDENFNIYKVSKFDVPTCFDLTFVIPSQIRRAMQINIDVQGIAFATVACADAQLIFM